MFLMYTEVYKDESPIFRFETGAAFMVVSTQVAT